MLGCPRDQQAVSELPSPPSGNFLNLCVSYSKQLRLCLFPPKSSKNKFFFFKSHTADFQMFVWICVSNVEFIAAVSQGHRFMQLTRIMQSTDLTNQDALRKKFLPITAVDSNIKVINPNEFVFF